MIRIFGLQIMTAKEMLNLRKEINEKIDECVSHLQKHDLDIRYQEQYNHANSDAIGAVMDFAMRRLPLKRNRKEMRTMQAKFNNSKPCKLIVIKDPKDYATP